MNTPRPKPGIVSDKCRVVRVIDGDTVEVEITKICKVRLVDCWAPETRRTDHPTERRFGREAKQELSEHLQVGDECTVKAESDGDLILGNNTSFGRLIGDIWVNDDMSVGDYMRATGLAFKTKAELEAFLTEQDNEQARRNYEEL